MRIYALIWMFLCESLVHVLGLFRGPSVPGKEGRHAEHAAPSVTDLLRRDRGGRAQRAFWRTSWELESSVSGIHIRLHSRRSSIYGPGLQTLRTILEL